MPRYRRGESDEIYQNKSKMAKSKCHEACEYITAAGAMLFGIAALIIFGSGFFAFILPRFWVTVPSEFYQLAAFFGKEGWRGSGDRRIK